MQRSHTNDYLKMILNTEDRIETIIGRFGKYQTFVFILVILGRYPTEFQISNVVFIIPNVNYVCLDERAQNATNFCPCDNPLYDRTTIMSSVTTEWNLICERRSLASFTQSMMQVGILAGSLFYSYISDRFGRRITLSVALFGTSIFSISSAVVTEFWMFVLCKFLIGSAIGGVILTSYTLLIELTGKSFRPYFVPLMEIPHTSAYLIQPFIAYFVRHWRHLSFATSVPWIFLIGYYWLLPESPRWLITVGRKKEAIDKLRVISKTNSRPVENIEAIVNKIEEESMKENDQERGNYVDLFRTSKIRIYTIINVLIWFCCSLMYFGVNQYIGNLPGNLYLNVVVSGVCLISGMILLGFAVYYLKRKVSIVISFLLGSVSLLILISVPSSEKSLRLALVAVGHSCASTSFVQLYLLTSEVFPTVVRNSALGTASVFARLGGFIAPFVISIGIDWIALALFSGSGLIATLLCCFLPEKKDSDLINTVKQI